MNANIIREITPLTQNDCFMIFSRVKNRFDFPLHYHEEFELNLILNAKGAKRIVGDHIEVIDDLELVLVGPNLSHAWFTHQSEGKEITEVTIQFHKDLLDERFLRKNQLSFIRTMLEHGQRGVLFARETIERLKERLLNLNRKAGFDSVLELFSILHDLSTSRNIRTLSDASFNSGTLHFNSRRIEKVFQYMNDNYSKPITLGEVAKIANMPEASFSRFIKREQGAPSSIASTRFVLGTRPGCSSRAPIVSRRSRMIAGSIISPTSTGSLRRRSPVRQRNSGRIFRGAGSLSSLPTYSTMFSSRSTRSPRVSPP